ncbi:MAG: chorismate mutase [Actinomycetota bacterium]
MQIRGLRGATSVPSDTKQNIVEATAELLKEMMDRNELSQDDLVSIIFTATRDLRSEFPAAAAREIGISDIPLLCASEIDVEGAIPKVIRVLMHISTTKDRSALHHIYLREAKPLRADLPQ